MDEIARSLVLAFTVLAGLAGVLIGVALARASR